MKDFDKKQKQQEEQAEQVFDKYRDEVDAVESAPQAKSVKPSSEALVAMGALLDRSDEIASTYDEAVGTNNLGAAIRRIIRPVIVGSIAQSPLAAISSVQALESRVSSVFAQRITAGNTRGNQIAGNTIADAYTLEKEIIGYASGEIVDPAVATYVIGATALAFTLPNVPVLKGSVEITVASTVIFDDSKGNLLSVSAQGLVG